MLCKPSSRRRPLQRRLARRRAGGVKSCVDSKRIRSCKTLRQPTCLPDKSCTESDRWSIKFASRYHGTQQYSVNALTDSSGTIKERYAYDAYGGLSIFDASGTARTTTAEGNRYTYTGREYDDVLDLYHYRARMYDSIAGRFLSRDPIGFEGGQWSLYMYVGGMPTNAADPSGLQIRFFPPEGDPRNEKSKLPGFHVADKPGWFRIVCHGGCHLDDVSEFSPKKPNPNWTPDGKGGPAFIPIPVNEMCAKILSHPSYKPGCKVEIIACQVGRGDYGERLAECLGGGSDVYTYPENINPVGNSFYCNNSPQDPKDLYAPDSGGNKPPVISPGLSDLEACYARCDRAFPGLRNWVLRSICKAKYCDVRYGNGSL
ncbi:tRNA(Glu)-specific nuclease WapA precursor [Stieleria neptunia]|uniref:tRNA(Glu)-specific nuclease WapA n=1 Tax=Stieleria neptunia TaxID=2527979 RepID=A0A518HRV5_9BACT|nr:tRNA(Glu)-specific nuclease WapA precursor [Stieleria neptunia]